MAGDSTGQNSRQFRFRAFKVPLKIRSADHFRVDLDHTTQPYFACQTLRAQYKWRPGESYLDTYELDLDANAPTLRQLVYEDLDRGIVAPKLGILDER